MFLDDLRHFVETDLLVSSRNLDHLGLSSGMHSDHVLGGKLELQAAGVVLIKVRHLIQVVQRLVSRLSSAGGL